MENRHFPSRGGISLALSGGAARGAFHLGAIQALYQNGYEIKAVSGSSIGAIVGVGIAAGKSPRELLDIFASKSFRKVIRFNPFGEGIFRINQRAAILREIAPEERLEELSIPVFVTTVASETGELRRYSSGECIPLLIASAAILPLFEPVIYRGEKLIDGGIFDNLPVEPLLDLPYPILGINLNPNVPHSGKGIKKMLRRTLFLSWHASVRRQIAQCDLYLSPPELGTYPYLGFKSLKRAFALGEEKMQLLLDSRAFSDKLVS